MTPCFNARYRRAALDPLYRYILCSVAAFIAACLLALVPAFAETARFAKRAPTDGEIASFVQSYLAREVERRGIPGAAIVVVRQGRPILSTAFGVSDLASKRAIDVERSLFRQGSISKLFAWILVMQLVEERRLDLDRDINDYLEFEVPQRFGRPVTMRHLMTHSAGFSDRLPLIQAGHHRLPLEDRVRENMPQLVYAPGEHVAYSNYGAALAAHIVERVAGQPFEQLVEERIFTRAGMAGSTFAQPVPEPLRARLVSNYSASARQPAPFDYVGFAPTGSLSATPSDMGRLVAALLLGGRGERGALLSEQSVSEMTRLHRPLAEDLEAGLGLGFMVGEYRGVRHVGHGGSMSAAATDLQLLPEQQLGWTLSFSGRGENGAAVPLRQELLRAVIDRFYAAPAMETVRQELSTAADVAGSYVPARRMHEGVLQLASLNLLEVRPGGAGALLIETEDGESRWLPVGSDRFIEARTGIPLSVTRDADGSIVALGSSYLNAVSDYQPAPTHLRVALPVLLIAPPLVLVAATAAAAMALARRSRKKDGDSAARGKLRRTAPWALLTVVIALVASAAYVLVAMAMPNAVGARTALPVLQLLGVACCAASLVLLADSTLAWRERRRGAAALTVWSLGALGAVGLSWLLITFGLASVPLLA